MQPTPPQPPAPTPNQPGMPAQGPGQPQQRPAGAPPPPQPQQQPSKITFTKSNIGPGAPAIGTAAPAAPSQPRETSMPLSAGDSGAGMPGVSAGGAGAPAAAAAPKITMFGREKRHEEAWSRTPNTTGSGAIHVKTFHCKLTEDALLYMDQAVNEWLDAHPQYEVKFVSSSIGTMTGKLKEPALICQVWV